MYRRPRRPVNILRGDLYEGQLYTSWNATDQLYVDAIASIGGGNNSSQRSIAPIAELP